MQTNEHNQTNEAKKLISTAGPIQTSKANKALQKLQSAGRGTLEICDHGTFVVSTFGDQTEAEKSVSDIRREKLQAIKEAYAYQITAENFKAFIADCEAAAAELEKLRPVVDKRTTPEQREAEAKARAEREAKAAKERTEREAKEANERQTVAALWPDLEQVAPGAYADQTLAARNIRRELKKNFPGVKFSVKSESYSGGDSVRVKWENGPTIKQVEALTSKYERGSFNGMEDIYEHSKEGRAFTSIFGGTKYLFTERKETCFEAVKEAFKSQMGESWGTDWEKEQAANREARNALSEIDLTGKGAFISRDWDKEAGKWVLTFEAAQTAPAQPAKPATCNGCGMGDEPCGFCADCGGVKIGRYMHTKKGREFSIVQLENKVEAETFNSLLSKARMLGGWYSRAWGATPGGFAFWDADKAADFAAGLNN